MVTLMTVVFVCFFKFFAHVIAPAMVIYDNACNLLSYCLNREPDFFRTTWFLVDRFHWHNHTGE